MVSSDPSGSALARAGQQTFAAAYDAWLVLKLERGAALRSRIEEAARLDGEAAYLVGSVEAARGLGAAGAAGASTDSLAPTATDPLAAYAASARSRLELATEELRARGQLEETEADQRDAALRARIEALADRAATRYRPALSLEVARLGGGSQVIVHVRQPSDDDALLLLRLLHGKLPSRYGFLRDDATDELGQPAPRFYPDEGLVPAQLTPATPEAEDALYDLPGRFLPVRTVLPVSLPGQATPRFRLVHRGPVLELEGRTTGPYEHRLPREVAELFTGHLLRLKLEGRLELSIAFA